MGSENQTWVLCKSSAFNCGDVSLALLFTLDPSEIAENHNLFTDLGTEV